MFIPMFLVLGVVDACITAYIIKLVLKGYHCGGRAEDFISEVFLLSVVVMSITLLGGDGSPTAKKLDILILIFPIVFFLDYIVIKKIFTFMKR